MIRNLSLLIKSSSEIQLAMINGLTGRLGEVLRYRYWKKRLRCLGDNVKIDSGVIFKNPEFISIAENCWIDRNVLILAGCAGNDRIIHRVSNPAFQLCEGELSIGENTHIGPNCVMSGIGGLQIGANCGIAANTTIYSFSHHYRNLAERRDKKQYYFTPRTDLANQAMFLGPVVIDDGCAVGLNSVILPGTTMKKGSWVASGSVIRGMIDKHTVVSEKRDYKYKTLEGFSFDG